MFLKNHHSGGTNFIATNEDASIVYYYNPMQRKIYIRGYFIQTTLWSSLTVKEHREMIEHDSSLKNVLENSWAYIYRKANEKYQ